MKERGSVLFFVCEYRRCLPHRIRWYDLPYSRNGKLFMAARGFGAFYNAKRPYPYDGVHTALPHCRDSPKIAVFPSDNQRGLALAERNYIDKLSGNCLYKSRRSERKIYAMITERVKQNDGNFVSNK